MLPDVMPVRQKKGESRMGNRRKGKCGAAFGRQGGKARLL